MASESEWLACRAAFYPGFIADTGGLKLLITSHFDYQEEFWLGPVRAVGMKARNLDNGQEVIWPAKDWVSLWANMAQTQAAKQPTNNGDGRIQATSEQTGSERLAG